MEGLEIIMLELPIDLPPHLAQRWASADIEDWAVCEISCKLFVRPERRGW